MTLRNRAFAVLIAVYLATLVGSSFLAMRTPYMAQYVVHEPWVVPYVVLTLMGSAVVSMPLWVRMAGRHGKNRTWSLAMTVAAAGCFASFSYGEGTWVRWPLLPSWWAPRRAAPPLSATRSWPTWWTATSSRPDTP